MKGAALQGVHACHASASSLSPPAKHKAVMPPPATRRVYHRTASAEELAVIEGREQRALRLSRCSMVLSRSDADYLRRHFPAATAAAAPLHVLLPALRSDMERLPAPGLGAESEEAGGGGGLAWATGRRHLACCVRLSPEKEPHRFVEVVEVMAARGSLERLGVVPAMCGAGWNSPYGADLRRRLQQNVPQVCVCVSVCVCVCVVGCPEGMPCMCTVKASSGAVQADVQCKDRCVCLPSGLALPQHVHTPGRSAWCTTPSWGQAIWRSCMPPPCSTCTRPRERAAGRGGGGVEAGGSCMLSHGLV